MGRALDCIRVDNGKQVENTCACVHCNTWIVRPPQEPPGIESDVNCTGLLYLTSSDFGPSVLQQMQKMEAPAALDLGLLKGKTKAGIFKSWHYVIG